MEPPLFFIERSRYRRQSRAIALSRERAAAIPREPFYSIDEFTLSPEWTLPFQRPDLTQIFAG